MFGAQPDGPPSTTLHPAACRHVCLCLCMHAACVYVHVLAWHVLAGAAPCPVRAELPAAALQHHKSPRQYGPRNQRVHSSRCGRVFRGRGLRYVQMPTAGSGGILRHTHRLQLRLPCHDPPDAVKVHWEEMTQGGVPLHACFSSVSGGRQPASQPVRARAHGAPNGMSRCLMSSVSLQPCSPSSSQKPLPATACLGSSRAGWGPTPWAPSAWPWPHAEPSVHVHPQGGQS